MLYWVEDHLKQVSSVPKSRKRFYEFQKRKLSEIDFKLMEDFVNKIIDDKKFVSDGSVKFVVPGWEVKSDWNGTPLIKIYTDACGNNIETSAMWLGLLFLETMINREETWYCSKTTFNGRHISQVVYWYRV